MSANLTDEQLRDLQENAETYTMVYSGYVLLALTELLALRAERAKPTPSDEKRASDLEKYGRYSTKADSDEMKAVYLRAFASIRAEGSAERAKLEADLEYRTSQRDNLYIRVAELDRTLTAAGAERAKLEAALRPFAKMAEHYRHKADDESILSASPARKVWIHITAGDFRRAAALAQPAESGATEPKLGTHGLNSNYGDCG